MRSTYRAWVSRKMPGFLQAEAGSRLTGVFALLVDAVAEPMLRAIYARFFASELVSDDVLATVGNERQIPRWPGESKRDYAVRLANAWTYWQWAGTLHGLRMVLEPFGFAFSIYEASAPSDLVPQIPFGGGNWKNFWIVITDHPWTQRYFGQLGVRIGDPGLALGSTMTAGQTDVLRRVIRTFRAAHTRCDSIIVVFDLAAWTALLASPGAADWSHVEQRPTFTAWIPCG
jgi:Phage tail protein (Tail_P2_I)